MASEAELKRLGVLVRDARGGRTLQEVSEASGLSIQYIAGIEKAYTSPGRGPITPSDAVLDALGRALDIPLSDLHGALGRMPEEEQYTDEERDLIRHFRGAPPPIKGAARAVLESAFREEDQAETTHGKKAE